MESAAYFNGDYEKSFEAAKQIFPIEDEVLSTIENTLYEQGYFTALEEMVSVMAEATQEGFMSPADVALFYLRIKEYDNVMELLEKGYEIHDPNMPYISTCIGHFDRLNENPRYIELLKKMKLPLL